MPTVGGIDWIEADLRTFKIEGFDVICLLGILFRMNMTLRTEPVRRSEGRVLLAGEFVRMPSIWTDPLSGR